MSLSLTTRTARNSIRFRRDKSDCDMHDFFLKENLSFVKSRSHSYIFSLTKSFNENIAIFYLLIAHESEKSFTIEDAFKINVQKTLSEWIE